MTKPEEFPEQDQPQPGKEYMMEPQPEVIGEDYRGSGKLSDKSVLITGGDSGIGRSTAVHMAREGANIAIVYLEEDQDAIETKSLVEREGAQCLVIPGDVKKQTFCEQAVKKVIDQFGDLNILVNNAAVQFPKNKIEDITTEDFRETFETNIYSYFYFAKATVPHLSEHDSIINTTSVTAYRGSTHLLDYSSTKGAIVSFTRSLSKMLAPRKIRVNGVAPGPIWTPLIPATFDDISDFGQDTPLGRAGQPSEIGPAMVFLASKDSSYMTGQIIHINGGEIVGG